MTARLLFLVFALAAVDWLAISSAAPPRVVAIKTNETFARSVTIAMPEQTFPLTGSFALDLRRAAADVTPAKSFSTAIGNLRVMSSNSAAKTVTLAMLMSQQDAALLSGNYQGDLVYTAGAIASNIQRFVFQVTQGVTTVTPGPPPAFSDLAGWAPITDILGASDPTIIQQTSLDAAAARKAADDAAAVSQTLLQPLAPQARKFTTGRDSGGAWLREQPKLSDIDLRGCIGYVRGANSDGGACDNQIPAAGVSGLAASATVDATNPVNVFFNRGGTGAVSVSLNTLIAGQRPTIYEFNGIDPDGVIDSTAGLTNLVSSGRKEPYVRNGVYKVSNAINIPQGVVIACEGGPSQTYFSVSNAWFNMSAAYVFRLGAQAGMRNCGVEFYQPDTALRSEVIQYPQAFEAPLQQFLLDNVRVSRAWSCLHAVGNFGLSNIPNFECGPLNNNDGAIKLDGSLGFVHIGSLKCRHYGMETMPSLLSVYRDGTTLCGNFGRIDGLSIDTLSLFEAGVRWSAAAANGLPQRIGNLNLDTDGAWVESYGGTIQIGHIYKTSTPAATKHFKIYAGTVDVADMNWIDTTSAGCSIDVQGGIFRLYGGYFSHQDGGSSAVCVSTGLAYFENIRLHLGATARTAPFFAQSGGGQMILRNLDGVGSGSGNVVSYATDNFANVMQNVNWPVSYKESFGFATSLGQYVQPRPVALGTANVTPNFVTNGTFAPTNRTSSSTIMRRGSHAVLALDEQFDAPAYSGASSAFRFSIANAPAPAGAGFRSCGGLTTDYVTAGAFLQVTPYVDYSAAGPLLYFQGTINAGGSQQLSTAALPSTGLTGVRFRTTCEYPVQ